MQVKNGRLENTEVPMRLAMNELLREEYRLDCERVLKAWNRALKSEGTSFQVTLPDHKFFRRQGIYKDHFFNPQGKLISEQEFMANKYKWLPSDEDREYVKSLMKPVHDVGQCANWIAKPKRGINGQPFEYEYVRL